jgi:hypothetical protein
VAGVTWKPSSAAVEFDRDDVALVVIMSATRFFIDIYPANFDTVN